MFGIAYFRFGTWSYPIMRYQTREQADHAARQLKTTTNAKEIRIFCLSSTHADAPPTR